MNQARMGLLVAAALLAMPATAMAQPKAAKTAAAAKAAKEAKDAADKAAKDEAAAAAAAAAAPPPAPAAAATDDGGGMSDICKIDPSACPQVDLDKAAARDMHEQMYAVQQIYALRYHRVEINPYYGLTLNDQFVSHNGPGLGINFYILNVLAIGVNGNFYQGLNSSSSFNLETSRAGRIGQPINEYQYSVAGNITYVPAYGKFAGFGNFIFHYDVFLLAGGGVISTRPIATIDPDNRTFNYSAKPMGHVGGGLRIFFNRWLSAVLELSDYIYSEQLEATTIATGLDANNKPNAQNPATWLGASSITNNVQAQLGLSIFLPFTWEYRLPK